MWHTISIEHIDNKIDILVGKYSIVMISRQKDDQTPSIVRKAAITLCMFLKGFEKTKETIIIMSSGWTYLKLSIRWANKHLDYEIDH